MVSFGSLCRRMGYTANGGTPAVKRSVAPVWRKSWKRMYRGMRLGHSLWPQPSRGQRRGSSSWCRSSCGVPLALQLRQNVQVPLDQPRATHRAAELVLERDVLAVHGPVGSRKEHLSVSSARQARANRP